MSGVSSSLLIGIGSTGSRLTLDDEREERGSLPGTKARESKIPSDEPGEISMGRTSEKEREERRTLRQRRKKLANERQRLLNLLLRPLHQVLHNEQVVLRRRILLKHLLPLIALPFRRRNAREEVVERAGDSELDEVDCDGGAGFRCCSEHLEALSVGRRSDGGRVGVEEGLDRAKEVGRQELLKLVGVVTVRVDDADDGEATLLDDALIGEGENVIEDGDGFGDEAERVKGEGTTTVGGGGDGGALNVEGEEVEVGKEGGETAFANDRRRDLLRNLLERLRQEEKVSNEEEGK